MNVIHLLPDTVANQIAAGEVIQRPASVIKELMENAIDAGATDIKVIVQDAGRTQIQVIDNGCGMSETDARLAFERHATSKISSAQDLYALRTMGFRGEALASIAAVAQVELLTRQENSELGIKIEIAGAEVTNQEPCATPKGSRFCIKNLFYNVPARRRFLKSDNVEMRHVTTEFIRVALAHPNIGATLVSNGQTVYNLTASNIKQRVAGVAGLSMAQHLLPIESKTSLISITGFVGTPETAKKTGGDQYFFVNDRYMRSAYFNKAVIDAYKGILAPDHVPAYFIYFNVDPQCIDVNVHPQKTEIKFDDEQAIWKILNSTVSSCLNDNSIMPSIDFDSGERIDIPTYMGQGTTTNTDTPAQTGYNPFALESQQAALYAGSHTSGSSQSYSSGPSFSSGSGYSNYRPQQSTEGWQNIYSSISSGAETIESSVFTGDDNADSTGAESQMKIFDSETIGSLTLSGSLMQIRQRYILTPTDAGLMIVDQHRAHERVLYDNLKAQIEHKNVDCQRLLFPETIAMGAEDLCIITELAPELAQVGIEVSVENDRGLVSISSIPALMDINTVRDMLEVLTYDCRNGEVDIERGAINYMLINLARHAAMPYGRTLNAEEMAALIKSLMESADKGRTPDGKTIIKILTDSDIESFFRR